MSRLLSRILCSTSSRAHAEGPSKPPQIPEPQALTEGTVDEFRAKAFIPKLPAAFPPGQFSSLPAIGKWFTAGSFLGRPTGLNHEYLSQYEDTVMSYEILAPATEDGEKPDFLQVQAPFAFFLEAAREKLELNIDGQKQFPPHSRTYLAQQSLRDIPMGMRADLPTPDIVAKTGKGDIYDSNIWMGRPPTYTPLHRDPNPNLFVQLAGTKMVRMLPPDVGAGVFAHVQKQLGRSASSRFRGPEMMEGPENMLLEDAIWVGDDAGTSRREYGMLQVELNAGDGLFIPTGWWHSVKGIGENMTGSANWWFR